ncbi:MAG: GNAT family N-acetyltransferase [Pseudobdellovibrionaceae bacterium]
MVLIEIKKIDTCDWFVEDVVKRWSVSEWGIQSLSCFDSSFETFVALHKGIPVGCALLSSEDLPSRKELTPWLSNLYIKEDYRKRGIGTQLVDFVANEAKRIGFPKMWLFTEREETLMLYSRLGWNFVESAIYEGKSAMLMNKIFKRDDYHAGSFDIQSGFNTTIRVIGVHPKFVPEPNSVPC